MALYSRVNEYGFLETPYRKVTPGKDGRMRVTDEIVYLAAYDEDDYFITDASVELDSEGYIVSERVPLRHRGQFFVGAATDVQLMDVSPQQIVGVSAALIPFLAHDDVNRALVGAAQETQAVPLVRAQRPLVGTGLEGIVARNSGVLVTAAEGGVVSYVDGDKIVVTRKNGEKDEYRLKKFRKSNQETCYNQKAVVSLGDRVKKGALLADGPSCDQGEIALGANLLYVLGGSYLRGRDGYLQPLG
jgi:DNA-directed RNA polymerase subunit beta